MYIFIKCLPRSLLHFPMTCSVRYQPISHTLYFMLHCACVLNNVVLTTVIEIQGERAQGGGGRQNNNYRAINLPKVIIYNSSQTTSPPPNTNFYHIQSIYYVNTLFIYKYELFWLKYWMEELVSVQLSE